VRPAAEPGEPVEPAVAPDISHDVQPAQAVEKEPAPKAAAVSDAIEQVNRVIEELKHALNDMEEVLETLEFAERQKIDDEREIESLQRALRQLHRPSAGALSRR
jgi:predicted RNase H-like nuclease (RuvC/YqgF family)